VQGHRFDRIPFSQSCRATVKELLANEGATGPDENGWLSATLPDGGSMSICLLRVENNPRLDGATIHVCKLTADVSELLFELLSHGEFLLLPMVIATSKEVAESIAAPWPRVRIVKTAKALHDILQAGPFEWWSDGRDRLAT
jgi:hypothetical protein